jgi:hypothetical protein
MRKCKHFQSMMENTFSAHCVTLSSQNTIHKCTYNIYVSLTLRGLILRDFLNVIDVMRSHDTLMLRCGKSSHYVSSFKLCSI